MGPLEEQQMLANETSLQPQIRLFLVYVYKHAYVQMYVHAHASIWGLEVNIGIVSQESHTPLFVYLLFQAASYWNLGVIQRLE